MANQPFGLTDLELRIFPGGEQGYPVEITLDSQQEFPRGYLPADIAPWISSGDLAADGQKLFDTFLSDANLRAAWAEARGRAPQRRIRLRIDPPAAELHALPWELVCENSVLLAANADTPFSRYLPIALPWGGAVEQRPIRILAAISNPDDLSQHNLAPLDVALERKTLQEAFASLSQISICFLEPPVTLERLEASLREGYHILHYLGHGVYNARRQQAALHLQDNQGHTRLVPDDELAGMLARLESGVKPQLVFLAACQSAARSTGDAFRGLAPRLVSIGVPAVVAMQDYVAIETARKFSSIFYARLLEHGQVDQACNEARSTLLTAGRPDAAVPVLFMRLKSGQLWSAEADARGKLLGGQKPQAFWGTFKSRVEEGTCVPVIGPRVHGRWLPLPHEVAQAWAEDRNLGGYPFGDKESLAHVAQYFDASGGDDWSRDQLLKTLGKEFKARLPEALQPQGKYKTLTALVQAVLRQELAAGEAPPGWPRLAAGDPNEPHQVLARLNLPLYITTNCDNFMFEALAAQGKKPRREVCRWLDEPPAQAGADDYEPTPDEPLVYHLFGSDEQKKSLVVSEDHYLDFMSSVLTRKDRIPYFVRGKLAESALMFVGYNLHDWEFRVVMRGLVKTLDFKFDYHHVAAQLEDVSEETESAVRDFMQQYFGKARINVFWGSPAQFIAELREQIEQWDEGEF